MEPIKNIIIKGSRKKNINLDIFFESNKKQKPVIIFSHGFKGFKDWGHFNPVAQYFADAGFAFVKFNFSYNGTTTENPTDFDDLEAFGNNNYTTELDDLGIVIDHVLNSNFFPDEIDKQKLYLLGHSRGGGISILKAGEDPRVKKLATWAAVADFTHRINNFNVKEWKQNGVLKTMNTRTKQEMPLYYQFYENTIANTIRLDIQKKAAELNIPFLIVHGTNDDAVPASDADVLHNKCKHSELFLIEGAGHTFGAKHPFTETEFPPHAQLAIDKTIYFFRN